MEKSNKIFRENFIKSWEINNDTIKDNDFYAVLSIHELKAIIEIIEQKKTYDDSDNRTAILYLKNSIQYPTQLQIKTVDC